MKRVVIANIDTGEVEEFDWDEDGEMPPFIRPRIKRDEKEDENQEPRVMRRSR